MQTSFQDINLSKIKKTETLKSFMKEKFTRQQKLIIALQRSENVTQNSALDIDKITAQTTRGQAQVLMVSVLGLTGNCTDNSGVAHHLVQISVPSR